MKLTQPELSFLHLLTQAKRDADAWQNRDPNLSQASITKLVAKHLVTAKPDDNDRRKSLYSITTLGMEITESDDADFDQSYPDPAPAKSPRVQAVLEDLELESAPAASHEAPDRYPHLAEAARQRSNGTQPAEPTPADSPSLRSGKGGQGGGDCATCDRNCEYRAAFDIAAKTMPELHQLRYALQQLRAKRKDS